MPLTRPLKVFLCHASADKPTVRELYRRLKGEGWIYPWLDEEELGVGQHWATAIEENLDEADVVLVFLSHNSVKKEGFVQKELNYAWELSLEKPIETIFLIPFRLDDCEVPRRLRSRQWGDYFGDKEESTYQNLLRSLKKRHQQKIKLEAEEQKQGGIVEELVRGNVAGEAKEKLTGRNLNDLDSPGGTISYQSPFYIERESDREAMQVLENNGFTMWIRGSSQTGKSSLLNRIMDEAKKRHISVAYIDFQTIDNSDLKKANIFFSSVLQPFILGTWSGRPNQRILEE